MIRNMCKSINRPGQPTQPIFKTLRSLRILIIHPKDREGEELIRHLNRIGCQVDAVWPIPSEIEPRIDVVIIMVREDQTRQLQDLFNDGRKLGPTIIALVDYEIPTVLQAVLDIGAQAVIGKPIRPFGVLTNLVLARQNWSQENHLNGKIHKLERKVAGMKKLNLAKALLMKLHNICEEEAYKILRDQAMAKRVTTEEIASSIINANEILSAGTKIGSSVKKLKIVE